MRTVYIIVIFALAAFSTTGCTQLGPMVGATMNNIVPEKRAGVELQGGLAPGWYLSNAVEEESRGSNVAVAALMLDAGEALPTKGLGIGARYVGGGDDNGYFEPMLRYRTFVDRDQNIAIGVTAFGTGASGEHKGASYDMFRVGAEVGVDVRVTPKNRWAELHLQGGAGLTGLKASGKYCINESDGYARDCDEDATTQSVEETSIGGAYPSAFAGMSLDLFKGVPVLHNVRLGAYMAGGLMPRHRAAIPGSQSAEDGERGWFSWGLNLSTGLGAW